MIYHLLVCSLSWRPQVPVRMDNVHNETKRFSKRIQGNCVYLDFLFSKLFLLIQEQFRAAAPHFNLPQTRTSASDCIFYTFSALFTVRCHCDCEIGVKPTLASILATENVPFIDAGDAFSACVLIYRPYCDTFNH